jgi:putative transposase
LKYRVVWCPKYRRPVLVKPVAARLKEWLRRKAEPLELTIHEMQVMPDHVPLFMEGTPRIGVAEMVNRTEGIHLARIARAVSVSQVAIA